MISKSLIPLCACLFSATTLSAANPPSISIIPQPVFAKTKSGAFRLQKSTRISYDFAISDAAFPAEYLAKHLRETTGFPIPVVNDREAKTTSAIRLELMPEASLGAEGYELDVASTRVLIRANHSAGLFYGVQSLLQMLPPTAKPSKACAIPAAVVRDQPRFAWRGMMLDVSRHFFPVASVKTFIDMLAMHKLNVFHWHLDDDQGWRLESKKFPKLTEISAWRVDREDLPWGSRSAPVREDEKGRYGGYYTQDDVREIIRYAAQRNITVIPEIEMPAHSQEVLAAYPQYSCTGGPFQVPSGGVWPNTNIFCAGNDATFQFIQELLDEVLDLFPSQYIHIGGDEADKLEWKRCSKCQERIKTEGLKDEKELQSYFVKRVAKYVASKGRKLIGWDEILEGGLAPNATVMSWRSFDGSVAAAKQGHDAVLSPVTHCYFDYLQGPRESEPLGIGGYLPLSQVYAFEPVSPELTPEQAQHILGGQANVWTEFIPTLSHLQYMTLPRMAALSEALWTPAKQRDFDGFAQRMKPQLQRYSALGYNFAQSAYFVDVNVQPDPKQHCLNVKLRSGLPAESIRYTLDGSDPTPASPRFHHPLQIKRSCAIAAASFQKGKRLAPVSKQEVFLHQGSFKPITLAIPFSKYAGSGPMTLCDGLRGSLTFNDGRWQGFDGTDFEAVVDLGKSQSIKSIAAGFLEDPGEWIFTPIRVDYEVSTDNIHFQPVASEEHPHGNLEVPTHIWNSQQTFPQVQARYIRVKAKNGKCPEWHAGKGQPAWMFVDEIIIQ